MTHTGLIRWEPFLRDVDTLAGRFNHLFDSSSRAPARESMTSWSPAVDIYDTGSAIVLEAELPGVEQRDLHVGVENNVLYISGQRRRRGDSGAGDGATFIRAERAFGEFNRAFALPTMVERSKIEAEYREGLLRLTLPKVETARPRQIDVKVH